jgi:hypothetical protein
LRGGDTNACPDKSPGHMALMVGAEHLNFAAPAARPTAIYPMEVDMIPERLQKSA